MNDKKGYEIPWWAIVLGFIFFPPVGLILLFLSLAGVRLPSKAAVQRHITSTGYVYQPNAASSNSTQPSSGRKPRWEKHPQSGRLLTALGGIVCAVAGLAFIDEFSFALRYGLLSYAEDWVAPLGFFCAGLVTLWNGLSRSRFSKRCRLYMGIIGKQNSVFLSDLAAGAGVSVKKVTADVQKMLSEGLLPMGYIDRASGRLVLSDQGYEPPQEPVKEPEPPQTAEDEDTAILREIREVNDAIPDEEMSRKIDRIEEITGKILEYQRKNPAKASELRQFLSYYLPTTLKILRAYAQMDAQGVEGENISATKRRIEEMMGKVVEGFEKQLDQLFKTDAMDITTDVEVLERMLDKDGLGSGMTMGG